MIDLIWLQISVKRPIDQVYVPLHPRHRLTSSPYTFYASTSAFVLDSEKIDGIDSTQLLTRDAASDVDMRSRKIYDVSIVTSTAEPAKFYSEFYEKADMIVPAANIAAGSLGPKVIASAIAVNAVGEVNNVTFSTITFNSEHFIDYRVYLTTPGVFASTIFAQYLYVSHVKNFVHPHSYDSTKQIYYVALEGGEAGVYVRETGSLQSGEARITLPEHFNLVAEDEMLTVVVDST